MILVSVVMPTYKNEGFTLNRAIESVIDQTYENWELIIVDDNKEEMYTKIAKKIISDFSDDRLIYLKNDTNLGSAKSRNRGIEIARGTYITFLDDDDEYLPKKVESQLNIMIEKNADFSLTDLNIFDDNNKLVRKRRHTYIKDDARLLHLHLMYHLTGTDTLMFKTTYLKQIDMFDEIDLGDEYYLMLKAIESKGKFVYLPECYVKAYVHANGIGISAGKDKEVGEKVLFQKKQRYFKFLKQSEINYVKMRHYLVLLSCGLKEKNFYKISINLFYSFLSSPISFIKFCLNRKEY